MDLTDFTKKPKKKPEPKYDENGIMIETPEEKENWRKI